MILEILVQEVEIGSGISVSGQERSNGPFLPSNLLIFQKFFAPSSFDTDSRMTCSISMTSRFGLLSSQIPCLACIISCDDPAGTSMRSLS